MLRGFKFPLGTLRDWEQGAAEPDQAARAYLTVIARDPDAVRKALQPLQRRAHEACANLAAIECSTAVTPIAWAARHRGHLAEA